MSQLGVPPGGSQPSQEQPSSDHSLLQKLQSGNPDAATEIYGRYARRLAALIRVQCSTALTRRVEIEDIVQSVFGSFFRKATRGYYDVPEGEEMWKLFLVIALNKVRAKGAFHRSAKRDVRLTQGDAALAYLPDSLIEQENTETFLKIVIDQAMEHFPPQSKQIVLLRIEGYQISEIATKTGRAKRTVERMLQEAREHLAALFEEAQ